MPVVKEEVDLRPLFTVYRLKLTDAASWSQEEPV